MNTEDQPEQWLVDMPDSPPPRIAALRRIVADHAFEKVDGCVVDMTTANLLVQVYDLLKSDKARHNFETAPLTRVVDIAWKATTHG